MPPKCVETIYRLPQVGKDIVQTSGKLLDIKHHQHHHRDRHRLSNPAKFAEGDSRSCDHNRSRDVRWSQELVPVTSGVASQGRGSGNNNPRASFPIYGFPVWSTM